MTKIESLQDIKKQAFQTEDPELAIENAIMNTCCLIREKIYKEINPDDNSTQGRLIHLGLNEASWSVVELEKEAKKSGFKGRSWRGKK